MGNWNIERWAAHIRTLISKDDFNKIKYNLDSWDISRRKTCVDYKYLGSTALIKACELERYGIIWYLVENCNADVNVESDANVTPLYIACSHGDQCMIEYLLKHGADIRWTDVKLRTYLMLFIENGTLCTFLISKGIDFLLRDLYYKTAFDYALEKSALVSLEMLIKCNVNINTKSYAGEMPITVACKNSNLDLLEYLISNGGNVHHLNKQDKTYLMCHIDKHSVCEVLVNSGININARDSRNKIALHYAAEKDASLDTLSLLLTNDADVFATDSGGKSALHIAIENQSLEKVNCLLSCGADPNCRDGVGNSSVQYAIDISGSNISILQSLLEYGADVNSVDEFGTRAIHYAVRLPSDEKTVRLLLKFGAMINSKTLSEKRALHYAVKNSDLKMTKFLLTHGSEVDCTDQQGKTPLHYAVRCCRSQMISLLVKYGADLNAKDNNGMGPMQEAANLKENALVEDFLQHLSINNLSKIESFELMAANCFIESSFEEGFQYLSTAITWRAANGLIEKPTTKINAILNNNREPQSHHELMSMGEDIDTLLIQAAIIKARILGPHHLAVTEILHNIARELEDTDELVELRIKQHVLETTLRTCYNDIGPIEKDIEQICNVLYNIGYLNFAFKDINPSMAVIMHAFEKFINWNDDPKSERTSCCYFVKKTVQNVVLVLYMFCTIAFEEKEVQTAKKYLRHFCEICPDKRIVSIVFHGIEEEELQISGQATEILVEMALSFGYPINTVDEDGSTPLHKLLTLTSPDEFTEDDDFGYVAAVRRFLQNGTHVCKTNRSGQSVLGLLKSVHYPICEVKDRTLQCLAAKVIIDNNIQYENIVPVHLLPFISEHGHFQDEW